MYLNIKFFGVDFGVKINTLKAFKIRGAACLNLLFIAVNPCITLNKFFVKKIPSKSFDSSS